MLNRNSNSSISKTQIPKGRKIENNHNIHVISKGHGHSNDNYKKSQDDEDMEVYDFKKPLKLVVSRNKENMDTNIPMKKSLVKVETGKSMSKIKKGNGTVKTIIGHKKVDSARSSLSKRTKSQTHIGVKKENNSKKSLSPKSSRAITSRTIKPLITERQKTLKPKIQTKIKKQTVASNPKIKKKKQFMEPQLLLNDSSIDLAKELENLHKNQVKLKKEPKKSTTKHEKKVIISEAINKQKPCLDLEPYQDSPQQITMTHRYKNQRKQKPTKIQPKIIKNSTKNLLQKQILAATTIQRAFRRYVERRNVQYFTYSVVTIQRWWRSLSRGRQSFDLPRLVAQSSLVTVQDFSHQNDGKFSKRLSISLINESQDENLRHRIKCLLQQNDSNIESNKNSKRKKIDFSPIKNQYPSGTEQNQRNLPLKIFSPKQLITEDDSQNFFQNLNNLQKTHKQKLLKNYNSQKQTIIKLWEQKLCSPRAQEGKLKDLDNRFNKQILRFEAGIKEVLRGISLTKKQQIFEQEQMPQYLNSPTTHLRYSQSKLNTSMNGFQQQPYSKKQIKQIEDISIQLSFAKQQQKQITPYSELKFDPSLQGIQIYIRGILQYLQQNEQWVRGFFELMRRPRGITLQIIISNLDQSDQSNKQTFKIPLYKHFEDQFISIISNQKAQEFNLKYLKLKQQYLNSKVDQIGQFQYFHIQAIIDSLNQQFNKQRVINSLTLDYTKNKFNHQSLECLQSSFSNVKEVILKNGSYLCGFIDDTNELQETCLNRIKQQRLRQMLFQQIKTQIQKSDGQEEVIEVQVYLGQSIVLDMFDEAIHQMLTVLIR